MLTETQKGTVLDAAGRGLKYKTIAAECLGDQDRWPEAASVCLYNGVRLRDVRKELGKGWRKAVRS